jgi:ankyrin repeat protein
MKNSSSASKIPMGTEGSQANEVQFLLACSNGDKDKVQELLKIVDPSYSHNQAFITLCQNGSADLVELLLKDSRVNPAARDNEAIRWASSKGNLSIVKILLKDTRVDPCSQKNFCLREACMENHIELIKVLLADSRIDPSARDNAAFRYVADSGPIEVVQLLLNDKRVDPSDRENEAIRKACLDGRIEVVQLLLLDSRINPADANNEAIKFAARNGHVDIVRLLVNDPRVEPLTLSPMVKKAKKKTLNKKPSAHMLPSKYDYLNEHSPDMSEYSSAEDECTKETVLEGDARKVAIQAKSLVFSDKEFENDYPSLSKASEPLNPKIEINYSKVVKQPVVVDNFDTESNVSASTTITPDSIVLKSTKKTLSFEEADMNYLPKPKRKSRLNKKPSARIIPSKYAHDYDLDEFDDDYESDEVVEQKPIEKTEIPKVLQTFSSEVFNVDDPLLPKIDVSAKKPVQANYVKAAKTAPADVAKVSVKQSTEVKKTVVLNVKRTMVPDVKPQASATAKSAPKGQAYVQDVAVVKTPKKKMRLNKKPSAYMLPSKYDYDMGDQDDDYSSYSEEEFSREEIIDILTKDSPKVVEKFSSQGFDANDPLLPKIDVKSAKKVSFDFVKAAKNAPADEPRMVVQRVIRTRPSFINIDVSKTTFADPKTKPKTTKLGSTKTVKIESTKTNKSKNDTAKVKADDIKEAALEGDLALVQELLQDSTVDPSINDNEAICNASRNGHLDIVLLLLKDMRTDPSANGCEAIIQAASKNHQKTVKVLLQDPRVNPNLLITEACKNGHSNVVKSILECPRFDVQNRDCSDALIYSCWKGHVEIVDLLLKDGRFDPSDADNEAIRYAARNGFVEIAKLLLADSRVDPNARNNEAFSDASRSGHYEVVKLLYPSLRPKTNGYK